MHIDEENNISGIDNLNSDSKNNSRSEINLFRNTEIIDKLVVKNNELLRDLEDADDEIEQLRIRLKENTIRISKNLFYIGLIVAGFLLYTGNTHLTEVTNRLVEMNMVIKDYKETIEKTKLYNTILEKKLGITVK